MERELEITVDCLSQALIRLEQLKNDEYPLDEEEQERKVNEILEGKF
jgi:hypothetical protein